MNKNSCMGNILKELTLLILPRRARTGVGNLKLWTFNYEKASKSTKDLPRQQVPITIRCNWSFNFRLSDIGKTWIPRRHYKICNYLRWKPIVNMDGLATTTTFQARLRQWVHAQFCMINKPTWTKLWQLANRTSS